MNQQTELFGHITEFLSESELSFDDRVQVYERLLEAFLDFGTKNLDEHLFIDPAFDTVWYERFPKLEEEEEWVKHRIPARGF